MLFDKRLVLEAPLPLDVKVVDILHFLLVVLLRVAEHTDLVSRLGRIGRIHQSCKWCLSKVVVLDPNLRHDSLDNLTFP